MNAHDPRAGSPEPQSDAPESSTAERRFVWPYTYPKLNRDFTAVLYTVPPLLGSAGTFVFHGGALWCTFEIVTGRRTLSREPHLVWMTAAFWFFAFAYLATGFVNGLGNGTLGTALWPLAFVVFPFSYSIWAISEKATLIRAALGGSIIACYGALAFALYDVLILGDRAEGGAGNAIVFATVTAFLGAIALIGAARWHGRLAAVAFAAFFASIGAVALSGTRGIWPAVVANLLIVAWSYRGDMPKRSRKTLTAATLSLVAVAGIVALIMVPRFGAAVADLQSLADRKFDTSLGFRFAMWAEGAKIWLERPVFGFGPNSVPALMTERIDPAFGISETFSHFHNVFLTTLVEAGLLGLAGLCAIIVVPIVLAVRTLLRMPGPSERFGAAMLLVLMSTFLTAGMTSIMVGHDILDTVFVMSCVLGTYLACGASRIAAGSGR